MTKSGDKDWLPHAEHIKRLPKKRTASAVLFFNSDGKLLMVHPTYKSTWILPGGVIEAYEFPTDAARREVQEELSLTITNVDFIAAIHTPRPTGEDDVIHFYFYGGELTADQISKIHLQSDELDEYKFVSIEEVPLISKASFVNYLPKILTAIQDKHPVLIENQEGKIE